MTNETIQRAARGRFAPGISGNPEGGRRGPRSMSMQRLDRLLEKHGPAVLNQAFERFQVCDEVLSALLIFWGGRLACAGGPLPAAGATAQ